MVYIGGILLKKFAFDLNILLDNNEFLDLKETEEHVEKESVLEWLAEIYPNEKYDTLFEEFNNGIRKNEINQGLLNSGRKINIKVSCKMKCIKKI